MEQIQKNYTLKNKIINQYMLGYLNTGGAGTKKVFKSSKKEEQIGEKSLANTKKFMQLATYNFCVFEINSHGH